jgi:ABC-type Fe3+ transport system substrate-binding protein
MFRALTCAALAAFATSAALAADYKDNPAARALYDKARQERRVMIWAPTKGEVEWLDEAFGKVFPGVKVEFFGDNDVATRAITEARGGRFELDAMYNSVTATAPMMQRNLAATIDWSALGADKADTAFDGRMVFTNKSLYGTGFIPGRIEGPAQWTELLDAKYRDKMVANVFLVPRLLGGLSLAWGFDKTMQYTRDLIGKTGLMLTKAPRETFLQSGERQIAVSEIESTYRRYIHDGVNYGVTLPEPIVITQFGVSVMDKAPRPNAARLLAGWLTTPEYRAIRAERTGQLSYEKDSANDVAKRIYSGAAQVVFDLPSNSAQREEAIRKFGPVVAGQQ